MVIDEIFFFWDKKMKGSLANCILKCIIKLQGIKQYGIEIEHQWNGIKCPKTLIVVVFCTRQKVISDPCGRFRNNG